jgi:ElaB/YqjD/DUF883 family membrane-anchored ribosome-binding protein
MSAQSTSDVLSPQRKLGESMAHDENSSSAVHELPNKVRTFVEKGKVKATEMEESFEHYVQAKPIKSVLIATGVGLLVGYLFARRR